MSSSTQNQALNALVFLYQEVLGITLGDFSAFARAKPSHHLPVVLTRDEVQRLLAALGGTYQLMGRLLLWGQRWACNGRSKGRCGWRGLTSRRRVTACGTVSLLICWKAVTN